MEAAGVRCPLWSQSGSSGQDLGVQWASGPDAGGKLDAVDTAARVGGQSRVGNEGKDGVRAVDGPDVRLSTKLTGHGRAEGADGGVELGEDRGWRGDGRGI